MQSVILMYIYQYTNQKYPLWIALLFGAIFVISYVLWSLSIADGVYTSVSISLGWLEFLCIAVAIYGAIYAHNQLTANYNHILHTQWLSYRKLHILWWIVGLLPLLYILCIMMAMAIIIIIIQSQLSFALLLIVVAIVLQSMLLYTTLYVLLPYIQRFVAIVFSLALYLAAYSVWLIYALAEQTDHIVRRVLYIFVYIIPQFFNYDINMLGQQWISSNFFTIAIVYGIYIIWLLLIGSSAYHRLPRK